MIEKLKVHNFQSWKDTEIEFHPHVNIIVGSSDSGKTSLLRALSWIAFNRPSGDAFRRWNTKDTFATIAFDGIEITRTKGKSPSDNQYKLSTMENPLTGFGQTVPPSVETALNLTDINVQKQLDAPFLISLPGPDISRKLNELAKLEVIDTTFSNMNSMVRQNNLDISVAQSEQARIAEKLEAYANLESMEADLVLIEQVSEEVEAILRQEANIGTIVTQLQSAELALTRIGDPTDGLRIVEQLTEIARFVSDMYAEESSLSVLIRSLESNQRLLESIPYTSDSEKDLNVILTVATEGRGLEEQEYILTGLIRSFETLYASQTKLDTELKQLEAKFHAEMPDVCPLCEQEVVR